MDHTTNHNQYLLASICFIFGSANLTLFLYSTGCLNCSGFPSKYTVVKAVLSAKTSSTSSKLPSLQLLAQISSISLCVSRPRNEVMGLDETSMMCRLCDEDRGSSESMALWEMYRSVSLGSAERWAREAEVRRLDCIERSVRFVREVRFCSEVSRCTTTHTRRRNPDLP
jgi:hypothetical protein